MKTLISKKLILASLVTIPVIIASHSLYAESLGKGVCFTLECAAQLGTTTYEYSKTGYLCLCGECDDELEEAEIELEVTTESCGEFEASDQYFKE